MNTYGGNCLVKETTRRNKGMNDRQDEEPPTPDRLRPPIRTKKVARELDAELLLRHDELSWCRCCEMVEKG